jgi:hypothetical protein
MKKCDLCGKELKHQGALNIHRIHCERKHLKQELATAKSCEHSYRLLNLSNAAERQANLQGYEEVCVKCQELR